MEKISPWVGVGLRHPHHDYFEQESPDIGWLEVHSENFSNLIPMRFRRCILCSADTPSVAMALGCHLGRLTQLMFNTFNSSSI
ncbi:DUF692 family protein [Enterovibrio sp. Hal110]